MSEHIAELNAPELARLRDWLTRPNGAWTSGRVTFDAVEHGGVLIRVSAYRAPAGWPDRRAPRTSQTGDSR